MVPRTTDEPAIAPAFIDCCAVTIKFLLRAIVDKVSNSITVSTGMVFGALARVLESTSKRAKIRENSTRESWINTRMLSVYVMRNNFALQPTRLLATLSAFTRHSDLRFLLSQSTKSTTCTCLQSCSALFERLLPAPWSACMTLKIEQLIQKTNDFQQTTNIIAIFQMIYELT